MSSTRTHCAIAFTSLLRILSFANADTFFEVGADPFLGQVVPTRPAIHAEIETALKNSRRGDVIKRLARLQQELQPTFDVLPKNEHGRLESPIVRYLLHRHFLRRHAWLVHGLAPNGKGWNGTSPDVILEGHVPERVEQILRTHLHDRGLDLRETAVFAAMLENLMHDDAVDRLQFAWDRCNLPPRGAVALKYIKCALDLYMVTYIPGVRWNTDDAAVVVKNALEIYPTFKSTASFVHKLIASRRLLLGRNLNLTDAERIVVDVSEQYGLWQDGECKSLQEKLLALGGHRSGRVDLRAFFKQAVVHGDWQFTESVPYLRVLGALDESSPQLPGIMIANYINGPAQYIAASHYYAISCLDECEPILSYIERTVNGPYATVSQIIELVSTRLDDSALPHSELMPGIKRSLEDIAEKHVGKVPLHGRLFAQWLHYMYPVQCSYPHIAGSITPVTAEVFEAQNGAGSSVEPEEAMRARIKDWDGEAADVWGIDGGLWNDTEELSSNDNARPSNLGSFDFSSLRLHHFGGIFGLTSMVMVIFMKMCLWSTVPHAASVSLLQVNA